MKKQSWPLFVPLALFACLITGLVVALAHSGGNKFALHIDEPAPATQLPLMETGDARFSTEDWLGRAYLVNYFASWCVPCHAEHEALLALARDQHIPIIGIAFKDEGGPVRGFLAREGNPFVGVAMDASGRTGIDWGITGVPETFLIDAAGIIKLHIVGPLTDDVVTQQLLPAWKGMQR
jgi:DsbE subfamily thiol:disulfide oxidoreductase